MGVGPPTSTTWYVGATGFGAGAALVLTARYAVATKAQELLKRILEPELKERIRLSYLVVVGCWGAVKMFGSVVKAAVVGIAQEGEDYV